MEGLSEEGDEVVRGQGGEGRRRGRRPGRKGLMGL